MLLPQRLPVIDTLPTAEPVAIVGLFSHLVSCLPAASLEQSLSDALLAVTDDCLQRSGLDHDLLIRQRTSVCVGYIPAGPHTTGEPVLFGATLAKALELETPGLTLEVGSASGMMAIHIARGWLSAGAGRLALAIEISPLETGQFTINLLLLQHMSDALSEGREVFGVVRNTLVSKKTSNELLLADCCKEANLPRNMVLRIDAPDSNLVTLMDWIQSYEEDIPCAESALSATGFCTSPETGLSVVLLLQAPFVAPIMAEDVSAQPEPRSVTFKATVAVPSKQDWKPFHQKLRKAWVKEKLGCQLAFLAPSHGED